MNTHRPYLIHKLKNHPTLPSPKPCFVSSDPAKTVALVWASTLSALLLLAAQASAASFSFSTGNPDGKMATASRPGPGSGVNQETESGDDFILSSQTLINSATITGLLPAGVSLSDVSQVLQIIL